MDAQNTCGEGGGGDSPGACLAVGKSLHRSSPRDDQSMGSFSVTASWHDRFISHCRNHHSFTAHSSPSCAVQGHTSQFNETTAPHPASRHRFLCSSNTWPLLTTTGMSLIGDSGAIFLSSVNTCIPLLVGRPRSSIIRSKRPEARTSSASCPSSTYVTMPRTDLRAQTGGCSVIG